uniref:Uncharacterized protein n=1 Tax=Bionectria ochroleuca TaxID=29856 RepID=A0A8H7N1L7_BIOOC
MDQQPEDIEFEIIRRMMDQDDFSVNEAINQVTTRATVLSQDARELEIHANDIADSMFDYALKTHHSQQSKLVNFITILQKTSIPHPDGGVATHPWSGAFWTDLPLIGMTWADYSASYAPEDSTNDSRGNEEYENFMAFVAQLSEIGVGRLNVTTQWSYKSLCEIFEEDNGGPTRVQVRVACIWFIYAPQKVWNDALLGRTYRENSFQVDSWVRWRKFLEESQTAAWLDEDTQELLRCALLNMYWRGGGIPTRDELYFRRRRI